MPQYSTDFVDTRRQAHENISRANGPNIQAQGVLKKASVLNGCLSGRTQPAVKSNFTKPPYVLNGYLKHGFKGDDNKAAPARTHEKQRNTFSAVCGPALAGRGSHGSAPCGILVNGTSRGHHVLTTSKPQATGFGPPATIRVKNQRWGRKKGHKKRSRRCTTVCFAGFNTGAMGVGNCTQLQPSHTSLTPTPVELPQHQYGT
ncbi:uncharacterized protein LOC129182207 isoform X3 [Dunckerocampus dactyliophorus]|uniref:uncharacterized protein LOC129182207 isoform X3 n=1 Tax=Dunckerocampus dactyliophorus TaxID=161453 RepID=UPI0024064C37|nr:uncharacterized protein LOC129182207 isoform X3 [Dunckerocampus dactyliophorus]